MIQIFGTWSICIRNGVPMGGDDIGAEPAKEPAPSEPSGGQRPFLPNIGLET